MNCIVVGAGIGGLYLANKLVLAGVSPENIIIIEKRPENNYIRPGHLAEEVFELVGRNLCVDMSHNETRHIKELERKMYQALQPKEVRFVQETFLALSQTEASRSGVVVTQQFDGTKATYPADFVFDCTGTSAMVAESVNRCLVSEHKAPVFVKSMLHSDNPLPHHLIAHIKVANRVEMPNFKGSRVAPSFLSGAQKIAFRERLMALGWEHNAFPTFFCHSWKKYEKICVYTEIPEHLTNLQIPDWIRLLLEINSNGEICDYTELEKTKKYATKPRITRFCSMPHRFNQAVYDGAGLPVVVLLFDALVGSDYRMQHGARNGVTCCDYLFSYITIENGRLMAIDAASFEAKVFQQIDGEHGGIVVDKLRARREAINDGYQHFANVYYEHAKSVDEVAAVPYFSTASTLIQQAFLLGKQQFDSQAPTLKNMDPYLDLLLKAHDMLLPEKQSERQVVHQELQRIISLLDKMLRQISLRFFSNLTERESNWFCWLLGVLSQHLKKVPSGIDATAADSLINKLLQDIKELKLALPAVEAPVPLRGMFGQPLPMPGRLRVVSIPHRSAEEAAGTSQSPGLS